MKRSKVLIVGSYPIVKPQHGGQKRAKAIFDFYRSELADARYVGVFHRGQYPEWSEDDLPLGDPKIIAKVDKHPYASELICGDAISNDIHVRSYMAKLLMDYKPNIIHIEQPFAYLGLKPLLSELGMKPFIVFGSQNIEYILKKRIFSELRVTHQLADRWVKKTKDLEYELSREADLVVAVNHEDAISHKEMGAKACIIAGNGIERSNAPEADIKYWEDIKKREKIDTILAFVGSGHPPNWEGFVNLIGTNMDFLPRNSKIIVAGGVSDYFDKNFNKNDVGFWSAIKTAGKLEEGRLAALLALSDIILLPIITERGSNLKTAEAILTRKKIVATDSTFHGFERFSSLPNVYIGNNKDEFKKAILKAIAAPYVTPSRYEVSLSEKVQWEYCLQPIKKALRKRLLVNKPAMLLQKIKRKLTLVNR